ncbi:glucuronate isomerase [Actinoplanes sp. KI2]|uniref:glucuronate isomerase n=1 Tax=Actinoplanes sp. KI2 TaxID=2983315 RepID=UPI0021D58DE6|nr:glucuronate isomerase [Actinoplanes sp. KI2]MCU7730848.1 glucuronate isomerase [Actinoplanes sp. KI2]
MAALTPHPDRLLPADPGVRSLARRLYETVRDLPIVSPHGHVDARLLRDDEPFADPASLLLQPDHYVTRLLHAGGVPPAALGVGRGPLPASASRAAWRLLCEHWHQLRGTPVRYWLTSTLADVFGITSQPSASNADELYDRIAAQLALPSHRPRALFERFGISFLATTDDPADDLSAHRALRGSLPVVPTFRPDRYLEVGRPGWTSYVKELGGDPGDYAGFIASLEARRRFFVSQGAVSADHGHLDAGTEPLDRVDAERIYRAAIGGTVTAGEATAFRRHMIFEMARMSCDDGLVMTIHPGIYRNHHPATLESFGPDTGHDIPVSLEYTRALQPLLSRFGTAPGFHLVLFTVDATVYSREIAPLAGFYPAVYAGAPWWFLDNPSEIRNYQRAVTETAGFSRMSGFIDDTRAFCSIPARHDMSRRLDAGFLASLVAEHRLDEEEAAETLTDLVVTQPRKVFKIC